MTKSSFDNLMIASIAVILVTVSILEKEKYSPVALLPLVLLFLSGKLYFRKQ
jgi:carbon starvation protein CstA